jgi:capsid protein
MKPGIGKRIGAAWKVLTAHYQGTRNDFARPYVPGAFQPAKWDLSPSTRRQLARRSRYWEKNSAIINRIADLFEQYTIGTGISFDPASDDEAWNRDFRQYWLDWEPVGDLQSDRGFNSLQAIVARAVLIDGESFLILTHDEDGNPRVQALESDRCDTPPDLADEEGKSIIDGVRVNGEGVPTGYYFTEQTGQDLYSSRSGQDYRLIPAESVVHCFEPSRVGLYRGEPMLYAVLRDQNHLDALQDLESKAANDAAEITRVLKNASGQVDVEDVMALGGVPPGNSGSRTVIEPSRGGRTIYLNHEDTFEQFHVERPSGATREYWTLLEHKICAGIGIPRQLVYPESIQGTVERSILDMAAAWFRIRSSGFARSFASIYWFILDHAVTKEARFADRPGNWRRYNWRPPRAVNVDIGRNSAAMVAEYAAGMRTLQDIYAEQGDDWRQKLTQKADEVVFINRLATERGIQPEEIVSQSLPPQPGAETAADDDNDNVPIINR